MISSEFKKLYDKLNVNQKLAVDTVEGCVMVIAGPGTGKTHILSLRIANILLKTQTSPESILALTFTQSGVFQMRERLLSIIGPVAYRIHINTFHGFCNELIKTYPEYFEELISSESITELEQIEIIQTLLEQKRYTLLRPIGDQSFFVKKSLAAIQELKQENITPKDFVRIINDQQIRFDKSTDMYHEKGSHKGKMKGKYIDLKRKIEKNKELVQLYVAYEKHLRQSKKYDYNDMLLFVIAAFEKHPDLLLQVQERYQYLLVDEHQDTNASQNKIVEQICSYFENPNLFVVGDEKQAIYRFQGASLENFLYFKNRYPQARLITLTSNYRSSQTILDAAGSLVAKNKLKLTHDDKLIAEVAYPKVNISIASFSHWQSEYEFIADKITELKSHNVLPKEIAVLVRNNKDMQYIIDSFEIKKIPFVLNQDFDVFRNPDVQKLVLLFKAISMIGSDRELVTAMHLDFLNIHPLDIYRLMEVSKIMKKSVWDILTTDFHKDIELLHRGTVLVFVKKLVEWNTKSHNGGFDDLFVDVLNDSSFLTYILGKQDAFERLEKITALYGEIKQLISRDYNFTLDSFLEYIELLDTHHVTVKRQLLNENEQAVNIMTAHKSKGLEFDYVFITNAYNGHWGNVRGRSHGFQIPWENLSNAPKPEGDENEDERRLFYVAMTRARKEIVISYAKTDEEGRELLPSQFIEEVDPLHKTMLDTGVLERKYLQNPIVHLLKKQTLPLSYKTYFQSLFAKKGLSATSLNNYIECPWRYFFRNLIGIPDKKTPLMIFGTAMHYAINEYLRSLRSRALNIDQILIKYDTSLQKQPLTTLEYEELLQMGKDILPFYYEKHMKNWTDNMQSELSIHGIYLTEDVMISGKIDMIELIKNRQVIVHDFKTSKPKSLNYILGKTKDSSGDYQRQLLFYKILLDRYKEGIMDMRIGTIDFLKPDSHHEFRSESIQIDKKEVMQLEKQIVSIAKEICDLTFWDKYCDEKECDYCRLRKFMKITL